MSERKEPYNTGKVTSAVDATVIKTLCQAIEVSHQNGALFFLAQELLKAGALPTASKELAIAMRQAAHRLKQGS